MKPVANLFDDTLRWASSGGEIYESCIRCSRCRRIWSWCNTYIVDDAGLTALCKECVLDYGYMKGN